MVTQCRCNYANADDRPDFALIGIRKLASGCGRACCPARTRAYTSADDEIKDIFHGFRPEPCVMLTSDRCRREARGLYIDSSFSRPTGSPTCTRTSPAFEGGGLCDPGRSKDRESRRISSI